MSNDYGAKKRKGMPVSLIVSVGAVVALLAAGGAVFVMQQKNGAAEVAAWTPKGPACQPVTKAAYDTFGSAANSAITYDGVKFARASGRQRCGDIPGDDGHGGGKVPVCQFSNPTALRITTPKGDFYYLPSSQPATVVVTRDQPSCVLAVNTAPDWFRN